MVTATASRRTAKTKTVRTPRYLVVAGSPDCSKFEPKGPDSYPDNFTLIDGHVAGDYSDLDEAIATCRKINEASILTNDTDYIWAMVVVKS